MSERSQRVVVLVSGNGSNLQAILDACATGQIDCQVVAVMSNNADAFGLQRGRDAGVPAVHVGRLTTETREAYDERLAHEVASFNPDLVILAGWMRILTMRFLGSFPNIVLNLHPALPGELAGTNAIGRAWDEAVAGARTTTGVMVHMVPDEGVDDGPVLATESIPINIEDSLANFERSVHALEHRLLVRVVAQLCTRQHDAKTTNVQTPPTASPATLPAPEATV